MGILFGKKKPGYHSGITNEGGARAGPRNAGGTGTATSTHTQGTQGTSASNTVQQTPRASPTPSDPGGGGAQGKPRSNSVVDDTAAPGTQGGSTSHFEVKVTPQPSATSAQAGGTADSVHADYVPVVMPGSGGGAQGTAASTASTVRLVHFTSTLLNSLICPFGCPTP